MEEDTVINIYDMTDPDWTLVGDGAEFGYVPSEPHRTPRKW